jgi:hypothetical protein
MGLSIEFVLLLIFPDPSGIRWPSRSFILYVFHRSFLGSPSGPIADLRMIEVRCDPPSSVFMLADALGVLHGWRSWRLTVRPVRLVLISYLVVYVFISFITCVS